MKVVDFMRLLPLLPLSKSSALTTRALTQKFFGLSPDQTPKSPQTRKIQRVLEELSDEEAFDSPPVGKVQDAYPPAYFLQNGNLVEWFMTEQVALNLLLAREAIKVAIGDDLLGTGFLEEAADHLVNETPETLRIWRKVRIARSGIGRQPPKIDPNVLRTLLQAVMSDRQVRREYLSSTGVRSTKDITILGLVMKDDTLYVLATEGLNDPPKHLPAHRILQAEVLHKPAQHREGFDLDAYIEEDYQLSHALQKENSLIELHLRVRSDYLHHFKERPLTKEQVLIPDATREGWTHLTALIPHTYMLKQFLQSMGPGVEVLAPENIRMEIVQEAREVMALYDGACENQAINGIDAPTYTFRTSSGRRSVSV